MYQEGKSDEHDEFKDAAALSPAEQTRERSMTALALERDEFARTKERMENEIRKLMNQVEEQQIQIKALEEAASSAVSHVDQEYYPQEKEAKILALEETVSSLNTTLESLQEEKNTLSKEVETTKMHLLESERKVQSLEEAMKSSQSLKGEMSASTAKILQLSTERDKVMIELEKAKKDIEKQQSEIAEVRQQLETQGKAFSEFRTASQSNLSVSKSKADDLAAALAAEKSIVMSLKEENEGLKKGRVESEKSFKDKSAELESSFSGQILLLRQDLSKSQKDKHEVDSQLAAVQDELKQARTQIEILSSSSKGKESELLEQLEIASLKTAKLSEELSLKENEFSAQKTELNAQISRLKTDIVRLTEENEGFKKKFEAESSAKAKLTSESQKAIASAESEVKLCKEEIKKLKASLDSASAKNEDLGGKLADFTRKEAELQKQYASMDSENKRLSERFELASKSASDFKKLAEDLEVELVKAKIELADAIDKFNSFEASAVAAAKKK